MSGSSAAVRFRDVSKVFARTRSSGGRSFLESFVGLLKREGATQRTFVALRDVSFTLEKGKTYGFIGANGAGKSTALKLVSGIIEPSSGSISVDGRVGALLELGAGFHPDLTGRENVYLNGAVLGLSRSQMHARFADIVAFSELEDFIDLPVKHYSSGMYVRLGFAIAVHTAPDILLVDEVLAVGDASFANKCLNRIAEMRRAGTTIVLVTHAVATVQSLCDEVVWFDHGCVAAQGGATDVVMAYLRHVVDGENAKARRLGSPGELSQGRSPRATCGVDAVEGRADHAAGARWGTGRLRVESVEICNGGGAPATSFVTGEPFEIRMHYVAHERVDRPVFGIAIHSRDGTHVTGPNSKFAGLDIRFVEGEGTVSYRLPSLPLLDGSYLVSVSVHERSDLEMYDYHDRCYAFRVYPGSTLERYGVVTLDAQWLHVADSPCSA